MNRGTYLPLENFKDYAASRSPLLRTAFCSGWSGKWCGEWHCNDSFSLSILGAEVTAVNLETGYTRIVTSSDSGEYSLPLLPLGTYSISVSKAGFGRFVQTGVTVEPGRSTPLPLPLSIAFGQEAVNVTADAAAISTES